MLCYFLLIMQVVLLEIYLFHIFKPFNAYSLTIFVLCSAIVAVASLCIVLFFKKDIYRWRKIDYELKENLPAIIALLVYCIMLSDIIYYKLPFENELQIIALGEKHEKSKGKEVWILNHKNQFYQNINVHDLKFDKNWKNKKGDMVAYLRFPSLSYWKGWTNLDGQLFFLTHKWSGKVKVKWGGKEKIYDLYSKKRSYIKVVLPKIPSLLSECLVRITITIQLLYLMVIIFVFAKRTFKTSILTDYKANP